METKNMLYLVSEYAPNGEIFGTYFYCLWKVIDIYWIHLLCSILSYVELDLQFLKKKNYEVPILIVQELNIKNSFNITLKRSNESHYFPDMNAS